MSALHFRPALSSQSLKKRLISDEESHYDFQLGRIEKDLDDICDISSASNGNNSDDDDKFSITRYCSCATSIERTIFLPKDNHIKNNVLT